MNRGPASSGPGSSGPSSSAALPSITSRQQRFNDFQKLVQEFKNTPNANPIQFLTRQYNSLNSSFSAADDEIARLKAASAALTAELSQIRGEQLEVSQAIVTQTYQQTGKS